jgi:hypothetical protein
LEGPTIEFFFKISTEVFSRGISKGIDEKRSPKIFGWKRAHMETP